MRAGAPLAFLLLSALVAGCSSQDPPAADGKAPAVPAGPGGASANQTSPGALPEWRVGQSWTHRWTLRFDGSEQSFDAEVVVANRSADGYELAADTLETALFHAAFFFPDLGTMAADLSTTTEGDFRFPWYAFPLEDGKTWAAVERNLDFDLQVVERPVTLTARFMPGDGAVPDHYMVEARSADGLRAAYDYQPDTRWFSDFRVFEGGDDLENWTYRIETVQVDPAWSGTWYRAHADLLLGYMSVAVPAAGMPPAPPTTFQLAPGHTHTQVLMFSFAAAAAAETVVVAPDGGTYHATAAPPAAQPVVHGAVPQTQILQREAVPGTWAVGSLPLDPLAGGGGVFAWGATVEQGNV